MFHQKQKQKARSVKRLTQFNVSDFLVKNDVHQDIERFLEEHKRKEEGQTDLAVFILSRSSKSLHDLVEITCKMHNTKASTEHEKTTRMEKL